MSLRFLRWTVAIARLLVQAGVIICLAWAVAAVVLLFIPVASINQKTCDRIKPGMTLAQVEEIIGAPPGHYDGVWGIHCPGAPQEPGKGSPWWIEWRGWRGKLLVPKPDEQEHTVAFYPGQVTELSPLHFVWERLTRMSFSHFLRRGWAHVVAGVAEFAVAVISMFFTILLETSRIPRDASHAVARHGRVGLVVGLLFVGVGFSINFAYIVIALTVAMIVTFARMPRVAADVPDAAAREGRLGLVLGLLFVDGVCWIPRGTCSGAFVLPWPAAVLVAALLTTLLIGLAWLIPAKPSAGPGRSKRKVLIAILTTYLGLDLAVALGSVWCNRHPLYFVPSGPISELVRDGYWFCGYIGYLPWTFEHLCLLSLQLFYCLGAGAIVGAMFGLLIGVSRMVVPDVSRSDGNNDSGEVAAVRL